MWNVNQTTCKVSSIGSLHSCIGKTLTRTVWCNKVLLHRHTLLQVIKNRVLDDWITLGSCFLRFSHQTTHTCELCNLVSTTTRTWVEHHKHSIEALVSLSHVFHNRLLQVVVNVCPCVNNLVVTFLISDKTHIKVGCDFVYLVLTLLHNSWFLCRNNNIIKVKRKTCQIWHAITQILDTIEEGTSTSHTYRLNNSWDKVTQWLLWNNAIEET